MSKELSMAGIERTLTKLTARWQKRHGGELPPGAAGHDGVERRTPASELEAKELRLGLHEPDLRQAKFFGEDEHRTIFDEMEERGRLAVEEGEESVRMWLEANAWLLDFFFADGPHPAKVMRRVYAWTKKFRPANIWDAGFRDLGNLLGESHAAMEWRIGKMIDDYAAGKGVVGHKMPWQRGQDVCDGYAAAQKNNVNRLGGKKSRKRELLNELSARKRKRPRKKNHSKAKPKPSKK